MKLLPHQIEDSAFLVEAPGVAGCFSGMGTGKTLTALEAAIKAGVERLLIVGPPISLRMWQNEAERHIRLPANIIRTGKDRVNLQPIQICSYDIAVRKHGELKEWLGLMKSALICDESHALKTWKAKRTQAILGDDGLAKYARFSWMLTGTPSTRWNDDLYPFLLRADPDGMKQRCGGTSMTRFKLRYCVQQKKQYGGMRKPVDMVVGNRNTDELRDWLYASAVAVRRDLKEVWDAMPPITFNDYYVELDASAELREMIAEAEKMSLSQLEKQVQSKEPALATLRRQIGMAKVRDAAAEIYERHDAAPEMPILVGAWHTDVIDLLQAMLEAKGLRVAALDGRTPAKEKARLEDDFNAGKLDVLVGQIGAMGVSLNLQKGGSVIVVVEEDWSPDIMDQFYARVYRMGQDKHVQVDTLRADLKIEKAVQRIANTKRYEHEKLNRQEENANV